MDRHPIPGAADARLTVLGFAGLFSVVLVGCASDSARASIVDARIDVPRFDAAVDTNVLVDGGADVEATDGQSEGAVPYCATGACDPQTQAGCSGTLTCVATSNGAVCAASIGEAEEGDECASAFDCRAGLLCAVEGRTGVCREVCCADSDCGQTRACTGDGVVFGNTRPSGYRTCETTRSCLAFAPADCPTGTSCYLVDTNGDFQCAVTGTHAGGETCSTPNECVPNHICVGVGVRRCAQLCRIGDVPSCSADARCQSQAYLPSDVGLCVTSQ